MTNSYRGTCFCGAVEIEVTGQPVAMGYCHCQSCRSWSAGPINAFSLWEPGAVAVVRGADQIASYARTPGSQRKWCKACGGHLLTDHPALKVTDVYAAIIPGLPFVPALHVHYQETVLQVRDGLPKMKDMPEPMGGSGATLPE